MRVKVSKTFANFMNKTFKKFNLPYRAKVETMSQGKYSCCVDSVWGNEKDMGYDDEGNNVFKVIKVSYPYEHFANPLYLTTKRLNEEFRRNHCKTMEDLENLIKDITEI